MKQPTPSRTTARIFLKPAFAACSLLADVTGGNRYAVWAKLKLGAALLGAAGVSGGCVPVQETEMCYAAGPASDTVAIDGSTGGSIELSVSQGMTLTGAIRDRVSSEFSFAVVDESGGTTLQQGDVVAGDGAMDEPTEEFTLAIDPTTPPGSYRLEFYSDPSSEQNPTTIAAFTLVVTS